jgi:hypothetical protein
MASPHGKISPIMMNMASKTRAQFDLSPDKGTYCQGVTRILRKIVHSRVVARDFEKE